MLFMGWFYSGFPFCGVHTSYPGNRQTWINCYQRYPCDCGDII